MTHITVMYPGNSDNDGLSGVAMMYKRVYLIFTTKIPGVAKVAAFCDPYYCEVPW